MSNNTFDTNNTNNTSADTHSTSITSDPVVNVVSRPKPITHRRRSGKADQRAHVTKAQAQQAIDHIVLQLTNDELPAFERNKIAVAILDKYYTYLASRDKKPRGGTARLPAKLTMRSRYATGDTGAGTGGTVQCGGGKVGVV